MTIRGVKTGNFVLDLTTITTFYPFWMSKLSPFQLRRVALRCERPLRTTWTLLLLWPTWLAAAVRDSTLCFVTERGFNEQVRWQKSRQNRVQRSIGHPRRENWRTNCPLFFAQAQPEAHGSVLELDGQTRLEKYNTGSIDCPLSKGYQAPHL